MALTKEINQTSTHIYGRLGDFWAQPYATRPTVMPFLHDQKVHDPSYDPYRMLSIQIRKPVQKTPSPVIRIARIITLAKSQVCKCTHSGAIIPFLSNVDL